MPPPTPPIGWSPGRLRAIAAADDLHVAPFREDGETPGTPTWVWSVVVDGALYARAYHGRASRWYRATLREGGGQITAASATDDVAFHPVDDDALCDRIDEAYRARYGGSPYLGAMISDRARAATVRISPRQHT